MNKTNGLKYLVVSIFIILTTLLASCTADDPLNENYYLKYSSELAQGSIYRYDSNNDGGYWHKYNLDAINLSPGASGATFIAPNASSLGGYQLNGLTELLYFSTHVEDDWDGTSSGVVEIWFEVNDDNSGGADEDDVVIQLECWHKLDGELTCTNHSLRGTTVVGKATQHKLFKMTITLDAIRNIETISFRINLDTITGDVTDIIVNYVEMKYQTHYPAMEAN